MLVTSEVAIPDVFNIGVAGGGLRGHAPQILENLVIWCIERRFFKQNSVIRLKWNIVLPPKIFAPPKFLGWCSIISSRDSKLAIVQ